MEIKNYLIILLILYILYLKKNDIIKAFILLKLKWLLIEKSNNKHQNKTEFDEISNFINEKITLNLEKNIVDKDMLEMCKYSLIGGKKIRPLIFISIFNSLSEIKSFKETPKHIYEMSMVIEYIHCASLILDDIMDNDMIRRDKLANYIKFGQSNSLLTTGIICNLSILNLLTSLEIFNKCPSNNKNLILIIGRFLTDIIQELTMGQFFDVINKDIPIKELINKKTSSLFEFCFVVPWLLVNKTENDEKLHDGIKRMRNIGKIFGNIFQIADDFEDYISDKQKKIYNVNIILKNGKESAFNTFNEKVNKFKTLCSIYHINNIVLENIIEQLNKKVVENYSLI
jgi:geranylgeranyl pyrophosphate synthase